MKSGTGFTLSRPCGAWLCAAVLLLPATASAMTEKEWRFRVYLDDREIGHHHFHLTRNGTHTELLARAQFEVTFLKIPFFRYRHENTEVWRSQCLQRIASTTDENGKQYRVEGAADGGLFQLTTQAGKQSLPPCISTFAYWDKSFLEQERLLNSQTGEYLDVEVRYLGEQSIRVRDESTPAHHYRLIADKASIELWYSQDDQWLALQSNTRNGGLLRYVIE